VQTSGKTVCEVSERLALGVVRWAHNLLQWKDETCTGSPKSHSGLRLTPCDGESYIRLVTNLDLG
jgi:hypothetical protein